MPHNRFGTVRFCATVIGFAILCLLASCGRIDLAFKDGVETCGYDAPAVRGAQTRVARFEIVDANPGVSLSRLQAEWLADGPGSWTPLVVTSRGCAFVPSHQSGYVRAKSSKSEALVLARVLAGQTTLSFRLTGKDDFSFNLVCPSSGIYVHSKLNLPLSFVWGQAPRRVGVRVWLEKKSAPGTKAATVVDIPYGDAGLPRIGPISTEALAEGDYLVVVHKVTAESSNPKFGERVVGGGSECVIHVDHHLPEVRDPGIPAVFALKDGFPLTPLRSDDVTQVCWETGASQESCNGPRSGHCATESAFQDTQSIVAPGPGRWHLYARARSRAGRLSETRCHTVTVSDGPPRITFRWDTDDWNLPFGVVDKPWLHLRGKVRIEHPHLPSAMLASKLECRVELALPSGAITSGHSIRCAEGRCVGKILNKWLPCDERIDLFVFEDWKIPQNKGALLRLRVRLDDGAGHEAEDFFPLFLSSPRWARRDYAATGEPLHDVSVYPYVHRFSDASDLQVFATWKGKVAAVGRSGESVTFPSEDFIGPSSGDEALGSLEATAFEDGTPVVVTRNREIMKFFVLPEATFASGGKPIAIAEGPWSNWWSTSHGPIEAKLLRLEGRVAGVTPDDTATILTSSGTSQTFPPPASERCEEFTVYKDQLVATCPNGVHALDETAGAWIHFDSAMHEDFERNRKRTVPAVGASQNAAELHQKLCLLLSPSIRERTECNAQEAKRNRDPSSVQPLWLQGHGRYFIGEDNAYDFDAAYDLDPTVLDGPIYFEKRGDVIWVSRNGYGTFVRIERSPSKVRSLAGFTYPARGASESSKFRLSPTLLKDGSFLVWGEQLKHLSAREGFVLADKLLETGSAPGPRTQRVFRSDSGQRYADNGTHLGYDGEKAWDVCGQTPATLPQAVTGEFSHDKDFGFVYVDPLNPKMLFDKFLVTLRTVDGPALFHCSGLPGERHKHIPWPFVDDKPYLDSESTTFWSDGSIAVIRANGDFAYGPTTSLALGKLQNLPGQVVGIRATSRPGIAFINVMLSNDRMLVFKADLRRGETTPVEMPSRALPDQPFNFTYDPWDKNGFEFVTVLEKEGDTEVPVLHIRKEGTDKWTRLVSATELGGACRDFTVAGGTGTCSRTITHAEPDGHGRIRILGAPFDLAFVTVDSDGSPVLEPAIR